MAEDIKDNLIREVFGDDTPAAPAPEAAEAAVQDEAAVEAPEAEAPAGEGPKDPRIKWFVIHTYSGYENKVKSNLERRMQSMRSQGGEKITQVLVPTEKEKEIKGGKRREVDRKIYPGYVLVEMVMDDDSWYVVRNTPGVTGFVGSGARPVPLEDAEVRQLLKQLRDETPKYRITFQKGSTVRITTGPFADFTGVVDEVMLEKEKVRVLVSIFGRATPVELNFGDVEKV
ncbi:MAG TPA: transcription termination/antitermination protein NusG [bacterium]|nr:transcription termination/antitermination protein NusG [bacterium]